MGYKFKPNKSVAKRFRVTGTGKLKRSKGFHTHLMSARDAKQRRGLHRSDVLHEGHARNMREMMGIKAMKPAKVAHDRKARIVAAAKTSEAGGEAADSKKVSKAERSKAKTARHLAAGMARKNAARAAGSPRKLSKAEKAKVVAAK